MQYFFWKKAVKIAEALGKLLPHPRWSPVAGALLQTSYLLLFYTLTNVFILSPRF